MPPLTDDDVNRLRIHADYLRRCARGALADLLDRAVDLALSGNAEGAERLDH